MFVLLCALVLQVGAFEHYYGKPISELYRSNDFRQEMYEILSKYHEPRPNRFDRIRSRCGAQTCYKHTSLSYRKARQHLFGELHLQKERGKNYIRSAYCRKKIRHSSLGPGRIPNPSVLNAEHTWPQSLFSRHESRGLQKSDLHALFPAIPRTNSQRGNHPFGIVDEPTQNTCDGVKMGFHRGSRRLFFEPPAEHRGNVARALFYFAVRYRMRIGSAEESQLRSWHREDPVDAFERNRNQKIFEIQKIRNPFVDFPGAVAQIRDF